MGLWKASDEVPGVWSSTRNQSDRQSSQIGNGKSAFLQQIGRSLLARLSVLIQRAS
jgi:hypothetical protein